MRRLVIIVALGALGASCTEAPGGDPRPTPVEAATRAGPLPASQPVDVRRTAWARLAALRPPGGWHILTARVTGGDLAVIGRRRPAPRRATARQVFEARLLDGTGALRELPEGARALLDARFSPDGRRLALVTAGGELRLWGLDRTEPRVVDGRVVAGLSFAPDSRRLAYVRGTLPELDVWVADLGGSPTRRIPRTRITRLPGPTLLPSFSTDGRRLLFVSSHGGRPALYVTPASGGPVQRLGRGARGTGVARVPTTWRPALWRHGVIVFETGGDVQVLSETGAHLWTISGATQPHWVGPRELAYQTQSGTATGFRTVRLPTGRGAP